MNQAARMPAVVDRVPPAGFFMASAVFHYLGPSFAVLLFAHVHPLGVAWLRIVSAACVFAAWRFPVRSPLAWSKPRAGEIVLLGLVLAAMNACFYFAIAKLPLATVAAIEFLGPIVIAVAGTRTWRNAAALAITVAGIAVLMRVQFSGEPLAFEFAFANCILFALYIVVGHRIARSRRACGSSIDALAAAMAVAAVAIMPAGIAPAVAAFKDPALLLAGAGVGVCSSVIPYVLDQLVMARISRPSFALMLAILPACAAVIGAIVLREVLTAHEIAGIALVTAGIAIHQDRTLERSHL